MIENIWEDVHRLYVVTSYVIFHKGLEHLWILVSAGGPGINPLWIPRDNSTINPTVLFIVYALVSFDMYMYTHETITTIKTVNISIQPPLAKFPHASNKFILLL